MTPYNVQNSVEPQAAGQCDFIGKVLRILLFRDNLPYGCVTWFIPVNSPAFPGSLQVFHQISQSYNARISRQNVRISRRLQILKLWGLTGMHDLSLSWPRCIPLKAHSEGLLNELQDFKGPYGKWQRSTPKVLGVTGSECSLVSCYCFRPGSR